MDTIGYAAAASQERTQACDGWQLHEFDQLPSTNTLAAQLPAWSAVRAATQTAGRGRAAERNWISDTGGLWLSAVVPCPGARAKWSILPLAAGWAIITALRDFGVTGVRLRWPNDIMVGRRKLAGLLVERFRDDTAVVGVGMNVFNSPETVDEMLLGMTARLADLAPGAYDLPAITRLVLRALHRVHMGLLDAGFQPIAEEMNHTWDTPRRVELTLAGRAHAFQGWFAGIDQHGRLRIVTERDGAAVYDATQVALLRELE